MDTPKVERIVSTVAITPITSTTATIGLDTAYVAGGYVAATTRALYANTVLYFGAAQTAVKVLKDYTLTTTPQVVEIVPVLAAVAAAAVADSYLAGVVCLESKQIDTNAQSDNANEDCDDGLLKSLYTGFTRTITLSGQVGSSASFWALMGQLGDKLENAFFYLDYNRLVGDYGLMQLSPIGFTNNQVGSIVKFSAQGNILKLARHLPANMVGVVDPLVPTQPILTSAGLTAQNASRRLYGFADLTIQ